MKHTIILLLASLVMAGCTQPEKATDVLGKAGYSNITITGYEVFGCSEDDNFHTGFTAIGPSGQPVNGVVCSGIMKGSTIRID